MQDSAIYSFIGETGDLFLVSSVLGLITCFVVYLVSLNKREGRNDYRHWDDKNILVVLLSDFAYDHFSVRQILSFLLFFVMSSVYAGAWMSLIVSVKYQTFNIAPFLLSLFVLLIFRATSEVFIAQIKTAENTSKLLRKD